VPPIRRPHRTRRRRGHRGHRSPAAVPTQAVTSTAPSFDASGGSPEKGKSSDRAPPCRHDRQHGGAPRGPPSQRHCATARSPADAAARRGAYKPQPPSHTRAPAAARPPPASAAGGSWSTQTMCAVGWDAATDGTAALHCAHLPSATGRPLGNPPTQQPAPARTHPSHHRRCGRSPRHVPVPPPLAPTRGRLRRCAEAA